MSQKRSAYTYRDGWLYWVQHHHASRVGTRVGYKRPDGYWYYNNQLVHRLVWEFHNGPVPKGLIVDHVNGNLDDCTIGNLRLATPSQSSANRGPMCVRQYPKGVRVFRGKFRAYIDGKHLGTYATEEGAFAARQAAESEYHRKEYFK